MALRQYTARVSRIRDLTHDVREIEFRLLEPPEISFKPGQFISFEIFPEGAPWPVIRPYSIASPPSQSSSLTIVLNYVRGGPGSTYLFGLRRGDEVQFTGPGGSFYLRDDPNRDVLFVATGTGIAPFRSMLFDLFSRPFSRTARLYWGLRSQRDLYYQDELEGLAKEHPNFTFVTTLSRPEGEWAGRIGRVTRLVEEEVTSVKNLAVYLCGSGQMIKDVTEVLNKKGLCPIYREKYYDDAGQEADG